VAGGASFFQDLCFTQGIEVSSWFFTLKRSTSELGEWRWNGIDIHADGLNDSRPTFESSSYLGDHRYPPHFFGPDNPQDDVEYRKNDAMYRFVTLNDGHRVNFLKYRGKQYLYDPSFGIGPFAGIFSDSIPEYVPMPEHSQEVFRRVYFDRAVDHLLGEVEFVSEEPGAATDISLFDIKTSLSAKPEITVVWDSLDYLRALRSIERGGQRDALGLAERSLDEYRTLLLRRTPLKVKKGSQLPGILPPLQMLQAAVMRWSKRTGSKLLDPELARLRRDATGYFRSILK
jgi:hypothetical protein